MPDMNEPLGLREGSQETVTFQLRRQDEDDEEPVPYEVTGKTVIMRRRSGANNRDSFSTADIPALLVASDPALGILQFTGDADTWKGAEARYKYELYFEVEASPGVWICFAETDNLAVEIERAFG